MKAEISSLNENMNICLLFILHYSKIRNYLRDNIILSYKQRILNIPFFRPQNLRFSTSEPQVFDLKTSGFRPRDLRFQTSKPLNAICLLENVTLKGTVKGV